LAAAELRSDTQPFWAVIRWKATLAAVCDGMPDRADAIATQYGVPGYSDMDRMLQSEGANIDVVSVLTPSGPHADHVIRLAKYQKHIIVEKPMALALADADRMLAAATSSGIRPLWLNKTGSTSRFSSCAARWRRADSVVSSWEP
jgi:predicted dehydrogenase